MAPKYPTRHLLLGLLCLALAWPVLAQNDLVARPGGKQKKREIDRQGDIRGNGLDTNTTGVVYTPKLVRFGVVQLIGLRFREGTKIIPATVVSRSDDQAVTTFGTNTNDGTPLKDGTPTDEILLLWGHRGEDGCVELWASVTTVEVRDGELLVAKAPIRRQIIKHSGSDIVTASVTDEGKHWRVLATVRHKETKIDFTFALLLDKNLKEKESAIIEIKQGDGKPIQYDMQVPKSRNGVGRAADSSEIVYSFIEIDDSNPAKHPWTLRVGTLDQKGKLDLKDKQLDATPSGKLSDAGGLDVACAYRLSRDNPESGRLCMGELVMVFHAQSDRCPGIGHRQIFAVTFDPAERKYGKVLEVTPCPKTFDIWSPTIDYSTQTGTFLVVFTSTSVSRRGEIKSLGLRFTDKGLRTTLPEESFMGFSAHSYDVVGFLPPIDNRALPAVSQGHFFVTHVEDQVDADVLYGTTIDMECLAGQDTLCLNDDDYRVRALYRTKQGESGYARAVSLTDDTGYFWFFDESNVEVVVKILTPCRGSGHAWVFAGGLTNVEVELFVEEVATGLVRRYFNPLDTAFQPIQHTKAFPCGKDALVAGTASEVGFVSADAAFDEWRRDLEALEVGAGIDGGLELGSAAAFASPRAECRANNTTLCLSNNRFQVEATFRTADGQSDAAKAVELTNDTGYFWFFKKSNVEAVIKIIDPCKKQKNFWVFGAGLTNVEVVVTVTDTTNGRKKVYRNPLGKAFRPIQDTAALPCS